MAFEAQYCSNVFVSCGRAKNDSYVYRDGRLVGVSIGDRWIPIDSALPAPSANAVASQEMATSEGGPKPAGAAVEQVAGGKATAVLLRSGQLDVAALDAAKAGTRVACVPLCLVPVGVVLLEGGTITLPAWAPWAAAGIGAAGIGGITGWWMSNKGKKEASETQAAPETGVAPAESTVSTAPANEGDKKSDEVKPKKSEEPASEKTAIDMEKQIERDLGKAARREFHDGKEKGSGDRTKSQLKEDARQLYEEAGKQPQVG